MADDLASDAELSRDLIQGAASAALATLEPAGGPFASFVLTAPAADGAPLLLLSRLAAHSRNLAGDPRASLLFVREPEPGSETMTAMRLTVTGSVTRDDTPEARRAFLARHADANRYAGFADFAFYRFEIASGHLVAGFGRIVDIDAQSLKMPPPRDRGSIGAGK